MKVPVKIDTETLTSTRTEDLKTLFLNQKRCTRILHKDLLDDEDIIDVLISLHLVLEIGLNTFFRNYIAFIQTDESVDWLEKMENIDKVSFLHKTIMFIYSNDFTSEIDAEKAKKYHSIISLIINFAKIRNLLLHGYTIMTVKNQTGQAKESFAKKIIDESNLYIQIENFKIIIDGMHFYIDNIDMRINKSYNATNIKVF